MSRDQQIVNKLTAMIPTLQRVRVTLRQQVADVDAALAAADDLAAIVRPSEPLRRGERTANLELAAIRRGHTLTAVGLLTGIGRERLADLCAGAPPTGDERDVLQRILPDWKAD